MHFKVILKYQQLSGQYFELFLTPLISSSNKLLYHLIVHCSLCHLNINGSILCGYFPLHKYVIAI